jgi:hypothetical protein
MGFSGGFVTSHPLWRLQKCELPGCNEGPSPDPEEPRPVQVLTFIRFSVICGLAFRMKGTRTKPERRVASARSLTAGFLKSRRSGLLLAIGNELLGFYGASVGPAAQESRDIENVFLDRIVHRRGAAVRVDTLRSRLARIFRNRLCCQSRFGLAGRRAQRRIH